VIHFAEEHTYWECGKVIRCDDFRELHSGKGKDYFSQDPVFPRRLNEAGYDRTVSFLRDLFSEYAQFGITKDGDRDIAISGLASRMNEVWDTTWAAGIFLCFAARLLLWKPRDGYARFSRVVPSWSWMTYTSIDFDFLPIKRLKVPPPTELRFEVSSSQQPRMLARVRAVQGCELQDKGGKFEIHDKYSKSVGSCWLDDATNRLLQYCVVLGMDGTGQEHKKADTEIEYYILVLGEGSGQNEFKRIGVGRLMACCVSKGYTEASLT
jgi:hypothetical protein